MSFAKTLHEVRAEIYAALTLDNTSGGGLPPLSIQSFDHAPSEDEIEQGPVCFLPRGGATIKDRTFVVPVVLFVGEYNPDPDTIDSPQPVDAQSRFDGLLDEISTKLDEAVFDWEADTGFTDPEGIYVCTWKVTLVLPDIVVV